MRCINNNITYQQRQVYNRKMRHQDTKWTSHSRWLKGSKPQNTGTNLRVQQLLVPVLVILIANKKTMQKIRQQIILQLPEHIWQEDRVSIRETIYLRSQMKAKLRSFICLLHSPKIWAQNIFNPNITWMQMGNNI